MKALLHKILGGLCVALFSVLALVVLWQVVSRYVLSSPSSASEEIARICLMWLGLLGASYAHLDNKHIAIKLLPELAPKERDTISRLLCQIFAVVLVIGGGKLCLSTLELHQTTPVLGLPVGLVYSVLPLSGLLLSVANYLHLSENKA